MERKTGFLFHELYMWHDTGQAALWYPPGLKVQPDQHAENAEIKQRMRNLMDVTGIRVSAGRYPGAPGNHG